MHKKLNPKYTCILLVFVLTGACSKIKIDPPIDKIVTDKVFSTEETAISAIRGIYATMMSNSGFASGGYGSVTLLAGRSADEFINFYSITDDMRQFSENDIVPTNGSLQAPLWNEPYKIIYASNSVIESLSRSNNITESVKQQLFGEAKFLRAFSYFYLTNLFGRVPLVLTTDYRANAVAPQASTDEIYAQIIKDLKEAKGQLTANYPGTDRTRANKWAATALLARVYLYIRDYENAEKFSDEVITQQDLYWLEPDLNNVFITSSKEAILQFFVPKIYDKNTNEGSAFILRAAPGATTNVVLNNDLYESFEEGDLRKYEWVGTFSSGADSWYFPYKYKVASGATPLIEYSMVLRLAEQYLIRAEARIHQDKIALGIADLNTIRERARQPVSAPIPYPLPDLSLSLEKDEALLAVEKERRIELFSEWGHRWLDLKRTGRASEIIGSLKPLHWEDTDQLYPIPASELLNNPNLRQNIGYNQ